jgi:precorrin-4/cobalt-precorrin-4 C11-methyltransferase
MAQVTREEKLIRTTFCLISPALNPSVSSRSRLYNPQHSHLLRPQI